MNRFDFLVQDSAFRLSAIVEVKARRGTDADWAAQLRRNILAHGNVPDAEFFLIVTTDRVYLWKGVGTEPRLAPPTHVLDAEPLFRPYLERAQIDLSRLSPEAFELLVASWLNDVIHAEQIGGGALGGQSVLMETGLLPALRGGQVASQVAA